MEKYVQTNLNMKLIFLDFDGVLNAYDEGSYMTHTPDEYGPSKSICDRIIDLCEKTGSRIIISSNWRKFDDNGYYKFNKYYYSNPLPKVYHILGKYIVGTLPPYRHTTKAEALIIWFEENNFVGEDWVVVDDDPRENLGKTLDWNIKNHYIETNPIYGINEKVIKEMEKFLK